MKQHRSVTAFVIGSLFIVVGIAVFGIRLVHPGPYAMPHGAAVYGAAGLFLLGGFLLWRGQLKNFGWIALAVGPLALFPALYSIMGESEEVISLYATDANGQVTDLRLWIVDREDGAWVGMQGSKAATHKLDGAKLQMLRSGKIQCTVPRLFEDRLTVGAIHKMKVDKYRVAQVFGAIGLYPTSASEQTVALRLDQCPS